MKRIRVGVFVVLVACILVGTLLFAGIPADEKAGSVAEPQNFGMSFDVVPDGTDYVMIAQVTNLDTGEALSSPRVRVASGENAVIKIGGGPDGGDIRMTFKASPGSTEITATVSVHGKVVPAQKTTIRI